MIWHFFLNNNRFTSLLLVALIGFGIYSIVVIPKESAPDISIPVGIVTTVFPGATALDVETLVTNEIERGLSGQLANVRKITSNSSDSISSIVVEFNSGVAIDKAINELTREVDKLRSQLPSNANDPIVSEINFSDQPIATIAIADNSLSAKEQTELAERVKKELERVQGVSRVEVSGVRAREIAIIVPESRLQQYSLSTTDIINSIRNLNTSLPIGRITVDTTSYAISFAEAIPNIGVISNLPIATPSGIPVTVGDLGIVLDSVAESTTLSRISQDGAPSETAFTIQVYKRPRGDVGKISAQVQQRLRELQDPNQLLETTTVYTILDVGAENANDLRGLTATGMQTVFFVMLILFITIGWREGILAGLAIPLSFLIGFIGLYLSGNTINFISLFALILGVGILVDSGIVMVEGINKRLKSDIDQDKRIASYEAVNAFAGPLTAGTLTTVAMFAGLFIVSGVTGEFIASIPYTLLFVLFASLLVALGFIPFLATLLLKRRNQTSLEQKQAYYASVIENAYNKFLTRFLQTRKYKIWFATMLMIGFFTALLLPVVGVVKVVFFEQTDINYVFIDVSLLEGSVLEDTDIVARQIEEVLYQYPEYVEGFSLTVGAGNSFSGDVGAGGLNSKHASFFINLRSNRPGTSSDFISILRESLPTIQGVTITASQPNNGPPVGSPIQVKITGDDISTLSVVTSQIEQVVKNIPGAVNVTSSNSSDTTELIYQFDPLIAARYGLSPLSVSSYLRSAVTGTEATNITVGAITIPIIVRVALNDNELTDIDQAKKTTPEILLGITLQSPTGGSLPVSTFGTITARESKTSIRHENQERIMTVGADTTPDITVIELTTLLRKELENISLPENVRVSIGGENEESDQAFGELFLALVIGILLMIAVLVLQFNSFRYTFYVLSIIPFSLIGILYGLAITQNTLSFPSIMGFIALTGIVVNNSILLIDRMNAVRREHPSVPILQVVIDSATQRLRPIVLTTVTTIIGMLPLLSSDPIWVPLAFAVIFGITFSVIITLLLIPVIYLRWPGKVDRI
jgi:multidrug efflux pump subunit AcrB